METRASYALIGASVLAGIVAFVAFILWLGHVQFNRDYAEYNVMFDGAVNGLSKGGEVRYLGINVGEVTDLSLDKKNPQRVVARIRIDAATPVKTDTRAILDFAGLTGVTFIQLRSGSETAELLPHRTGQDLPIIETERTQLAEIFEGGQDLIATAQVTLTQINSVLDKENAESLKETLKNIETITGAFADDEQLMTDAAEALASFTRAGRAVGDAADTLTGLGTDAQRYLNEIVSDARDLFANANEAVEHADAAIVESEVAIRETRKAIQDPTVETVEEVRLLAQEMRLLVRRFDRIAREIEQNPQAFIQGSPKPYKDE